MSNPATPMRWLAFVAVIAALALGGLGAWSDAAAEEHKSDCPPAPDLRPVFVPRPPWADPVPNTGMLWRIEKDGRHSYLHATTHVATAAFATPGPFVMRVLRAVDVLALELNITDPAAVKDTLAVARTRAAPRWSPEVQMRIAAAADVACARAQVDAMVGTTMQLTTLMLLDARRAGLEIAFGRDLLLATFANRDGKPVVSLETAATHGAVAGVIGAPTSPASLLDQIEDGVAQRVMRKIVHSWATGDLERLEDVTSWCECANAEPVRPLLAKVNDSRNPGLADGITKLHDSGKSVLAAIGALHMTGPQAVQRLLVERGFVVERLH